MPYGSFGSTTTRKPRARASILVDGVSSKPASQPTLEQIKEELGIKAGTLINEAADLGDDGHYRFALRKESKAGAILDVLEYIKTGVWPEERAPDPTGDTPSETLAERYEELTDSEA